MQLTLHADYSLRVLIYLAIHQDRLVPTAEISKAYGISEHHLVKVVHHLGESGVVLSRRGRSGGSRLAKAPEEIRIGDVLSGAEPDFCLVECFDKKKSTCPIDRVCTLKDLLQRASRAFIDVLNDKTLADVVGHGHGSQIDECLFAKR